MLQTQDDLRSTQDYTCFAVRAAASAFVEERIFSWLIIFDGLVQMSKVYIVQTFLCSKRTTC